MAQRFPRACLAAVFIAAGGAPARLEAQLPEPPPAPPGAAGRAGAAAQSAFIRTGHWFNGFGTAVGRESARFFVKQGEFWRRFGWSVAGCEKPPGPRPLKADQL